MLVYAFGNPFLGGTYVLATPSSKKKKIFLYKNDCGEEISNLHNNSFTLLRDQKHEKLKNFYQGNIIVNPLYWFPKGSLDFLRWTNSQEAWVKIEIDVKVVFTIYISDQSNRNSFKFMKSKVMNYFCCQVKKFSPCQILFSVANFLVE